MKLLRLSGKYLSFFVSLAIVFSSISPAKASFDDIIELNLIIDGVNQTYVGQKIKLVINGSELKELEIPPINYNGQLLMPAAEVLEALGAIYTWYESTGEMLVSIYNKLMVLHADNEYVNLNGTQMQMPIPPKLVSGKFMIPLRFIDNGLELTVTWDDINKIIYIWDNSPYNQGEASAPPNVSIPSAPSAGDGAYVPATNSSGYPPLLNSIDSMSESLIAEQARDISLAPIEAADFPPTKITNISIPEDKDNNFIITASSEISGVEKILLPDNRIVLDILNAEFAMSQGTYEADHPNVMQVRVAQNQVAPELITRVVFDIKAASDFSVAISADRKSIMVSFQRNAVIDINFSTDGINDIITLKTQNRAILNVFPLTDPRRIIIDTPNSEMQKIMNEDVNGLFVKNIRSELFESRTARIELSISRDASYEINDDGTTISIILSEPTYKNIEYNAETKIIKFAKANGIFVDINAIELNDEYNDLRYSLTLPENFEKAIGYGEFVIKDDYLHSVLVRTVDGRTQITLFEKRVLALTIYEDSANIYIKLLEPREKYDKIVILDPGHGGRDGGTDGFGLVEKDIVLDIVKRTLKLLEVDGSVKAYSTRLTDVYPGLHERVDFGNAIEADLFISVHINSAEGNSSASGTEVYYYPHENDNIIGYTGFDAAKVLQKNLIEKLGTRDRKVKEASFVVIKYNNMPAAFIETAFLSNPAEAGRLATDYFRMQAADAIYISIIEIFKDYKPKR